MISLRPPLIMTSDDRHYRVLVWSVPTPLTGSLLLLIAQSLNTLTLPPLLPGATPPRPRDLPRSVPVNTTVVLSASPDARRAQNQQPEPQLKSQYQYHQYSSAFSPVTSEFESSRAAAYYTHVIRTSEPHFAILALRHPAHSAVELGAGNARPGLWDPARLSHLESSFRRRAALFQETVLLESLATNRRAPAQFLRRIGFSAAQAADMATGTSRKPAEEMKASLFLCGRWCRNRTAASWALTPLRPFFRGGGDGFGAGVVTVGTAEQREEEEQLRFQPNNLLRSTRRDKMGARPPSPASFLATERSIRSHPLPKKAAFDLARALCPSLMSFYGTAFPELSVSESRPAKRWLRAVARLMTIVDARSLKVSGTSTTRHSSASSSSSSSSLSSSSSSSSPSYSNETAPSSASPYFTTFDRAEVVAVAVVDDRWRGLLLNWAGALERVGFRHYLFFAADRKLHDFLEGLGAPSFFFS